VVLWECNPDTFIFSHVSRFAEQLLGFPRAEWYAPGFWAAHIHAEDREEAIAYCLRFTLAKQDHRFEYRMVRSDGQIVWVEDVVKVVIERGTVVSLRGVLLDIGVEEDQRESEERFRSAFDFAAIGMALVAPDGRWRKVNRSLCDIVGYTEEELLARDFQSITHPDDLDTDLGFVRQMLDGSIPYYHMEKRYFHKNGGLVWILLSVSLLRDRRGEPMYFISQIQDITERKRAVEALQGSVLRLKALSHQILETQETERRRIARELHDEVGQMLTTIGLRLHQLKDVCGPEVHSALNQEIGFVNRTIEQVRELSLNLRPPMLDVLGLEAALRWYAENQRQRTGLDVQLVGHLEGPRLDPDLEIACFRVVQEALTNVVRHAHAKCVWIELKEEDSKLHLVIHDDGIGFDVAAKRECAGQGSSFGVLAMQERVELLAGQFEVESAPGAGTWIRASFPLAAPSAPQTHLEANR
ncbi:MAG TPA: PAS domain S-box protein, partial [Myxococcaceae bacterium]|nr:PAS domain S-box protein [Myxococcaceae bacterium]